MKTDRTKALKPLNSLSAAARLTGMDRTTLRRGVNEGTIDSVVVHIRRLIPASEVLRLLRAREGGEK